MNLALVTHNVIHGDGQGRVNYELTRYLLAHDVSVTLIANRVDSALVELGADWIPIQTGSLGEAIDLVKIWRFKRKADRLLQRIGPQFDAVMACGVVLSIPHTLNAVHFAHGGWRRSPFHASKVQTSLNGAYQWIFSVLNDRWERETLSNAQRIVAVSDMVKQELIHSGLPEEEIEVIVNGVDLDEFHPGTADRAALGLPDKVPLGLFVGDIRSPIKNPDGVLGAMPKVPDMHLAVAGTLEGSFLPALADQLGIPDRVHFLGFRDDIPVLMRAADFFTLPSRRDSCPLVLLEAMASGLPVITSRMVGTANLVPPECGFVLDTPDDHDTLVHGLRILSRKPDRCKAMGRAARATAEEHSWKRMARQYHQLLEQLVDAPARPTSLQSAPS